MPKRSSMKHVEDTNQVAALMVHKTINGKNIAAVYLGRKGGVKGGPARAAKLSALERSKIARQAAYARWKKAESE